MKMTLSGTKKFFPAGFLFATLIIVAGCGANNLGDARTEGNNNAVSEGAISGSVVSGGTVAVGKVPDNQNQETKGRFCSDTNLYLEKITKRTEDRVYTEIIQRHLDGSSPKKIELGESFGKMIGVADGWLYYTTRVEDELGETISSEIARVPIEKDADGYDVIDSSRAEVVISNDTGWVDIESQNFYVDSEYLIYSRGEGSDVVKYDIRNQKEISVLSDFENETMWISEIWRADNQYCLVTSDGPRKAFAQPVDGAEWTRIDDIDELEMSDTMTHGDRYFFFDLCIADPDGDSESEYDNDGIRMYDGKDVQNFVFDWQLEQEVAKAEHLDIKKNKVYTYPDRLFYQDGRCYFEMHAEWKSEGHSYEKYLIFSKGVDETNIRYEKKLTECMRNNGKDREGEWREVSGRKEKVLYSVTVNDARCIAMKGEKAYISTYDSKKKKQCLAYYELESGEFQWITEKDAEYYELYYDGRHMLGWDFLHKPKKGDFIDCDLNGTNNIYFFEK